MLALSYAGLFRHGGSVPASPGIPDQAARAAKPGQIADKERPAPSRTDGGAPGDARDVLQAAMAGKNPVSRGELLQAWIDRDPGAAIAWFAGQKGAADGLHQQARDLLAQTLARGGRPAEVLAWMQQSLPANVRQELYAPFFREWTRSDAAASAGRLAQLAASSPSAAWNDLLAQAAVQWAGADLDRAVAWAESLPEGQAKSQALAQMSWQWAEVDLQSAAAYAAGHDNPVMLRNVAAKWGETDPVAAAAWLAGLPDGDARNRAVESLVPVWAQKDPVAAATYAAGISPDETQNRAVVAVVSVWAGTQPAQAAQWVREFPEGAAREQAMEELMNCWAGNNTTAAAQWLQSMPPARSRDVAVSAFSSALDHTDPEVAFQWASTIADKTMRDQQQQNSGRIWLQKNPGSARASILQSALPDNIKAQLLAGGG